MKRNVIALLVICVIVLSGCGKTTPEEKSEETVQDIQQQEIADDFEELIANYAQTECQFRYCGTAIPFLTVRSTAR